MGIGNTKNGKLLYHLTELDNLDSILKNGLCSRKIVKANNVSFADVADQEIITKRTMLGLDEYVPFHFHPYSSFDVAVKNTYSDKEFIYICITRELAQFNKFKILPEHPLSIDDCKLLEYDDGFNKIDWDTMHTLGTYDEYTKHVKMAECLTNLRVIAKHFNSICVRNEEIKLQVEKKLKLNNIVNQPPYVNVQKWF